MPLGALDRVVRGHVDVGGAGRERAFGVGRDPVEPVGRRRARLVDRPDAPGLLDRLVGPGAGHDVVRRGPGGQEVHRHHRELEAGATLEEEDLVAVGDVRQLPDVRPRPCR